MASSDLDAPAWVSRSIAARSPLGFLSICVPVFLLSSFTLSGAAPSFGQSQSTQEQTQAQDQVQAQKDQSVAETARQERTRKQNQQRKLKHVYTAEDLKREHILTPEDRAQIEARKNQSPSFAPDSQKRQDAVDALATAPQDGHSPSTSVTSANVPLGDVARRYRREKDSRQLQRSAQFPLPFADAPVLASPKPPAQPLLPRVSVEPSSVVPPAPRVVRPSRPFVKRSPFERPRVLPAPAVVEPRRGLAPAPLVPRVLPAPPAPRVEPSPSISGKFVIVTVKPGDSLWKFAASRLGDGHRWQELLALNPGLHDPDLLQVGSQIVVPAYPAAPRPPAKYTVRHGDTLWSVAQTQLHRGSAWSCIAQANADLLDANLIREGQVLFLPASCLP